MTPQAKCQFCGATEFNEAVEPEDGLYKIKCRRCDATFLASLTPITLGPPSEEPIFWKGRTDFDAFDIFDEELDSYLRDLEDINP